MVDNLDETVDDPRAFVNLALVCDLKLGSRGKFARGQDAYV